MFKDKSHNETTGFHSVYCYTTNIINTDISHRNSTLNVNVLILKSHIFNE